MEPDASPGPLPVHPMETPYLQREPRPGAGQGPRHNQGAQPGPNRAPAGAESRVPQPEQTWLPSPRPGPCPDTYIPVPRYHVESTRACCSTLPWQVQENQVNSSIPIPGTSVPAFVPIASNPTGVSLSAPSAMSTTIMRNFVKDQISLTSRRDSHF